VRNHWIATLLMALVAPVAAAQAIGDPMRPPASALTPSDDASLAVVPASRLQSTLVSAGQRSAVIDGRVYREGDPVGDARLVAIGVGWVRLHGPGGRTELRLSYTPLQRRTPAR
jgi:hypothetical protein